MKTLGKHPIAGFVKIILKIAWYIQLFFLVFLTIAIGIKFFKNGTTHPTPETVEVRLTQSKTVPVSTVDPGRALSTASLKLDSGKLTFNHKSSKAVIAFNLLSMLIAFSISLSITFLLRKIFQTLTMDSPFLAINARRLKTIAFLVMLSSVTSFIHDLMVNWYLKEHFAVDGSAIRAHLVVDVKTLFAGLIILIIAEVFRSGTVLKEEQDLTV
jgi:hypothetical protein